MLQICPNGADVRQEAAKWYRLAADQGDAIGRNALGDMYNNGKGVLQDYKEAVQLFELAALQGLASAQTNLGRNYYIGHGVLQDNVLAHMWSNVAAANGSENGGSNRDKISKGMTPAAIEKAQAMARGCMSSGYTMCGY